MAVIGLSPADPEIAAAVFKAHLDALWSTAWIARRGWRRKELDSLHTLVTLPARREQGEIDMYFVRLGAEYYDLGPPTVYFVQDDGETLASPNSKFYPAFLRVPPWFQLHAAYGYPPPRGSGQLVCFSFSADYYLSDHTPSDSERWRQGTHTVSATLSRLAEVLAPPFYRQPSI